jgi:hypothetical protein
MIVQDRQLVYKTEYKTGINQLKFCLYYSTSPSKILAYEPEYNPEHSSLIMFSAEIKQARY